MSAMWQDRRLFLSSTFRDFHAERDHLHEVVFPALEERLRARRCHLVPVDLRWGVETGGEAQADRKEMLVLKVCLGEIDRCKPFLLVLLGGRYGWIPPGSRMADAAREAGFGADLSGKSVTALEIEYGVLAHAAAERRAFVYVRDPLPYDQMPPDVAPTFSERHAGDPGAPDRDRKLSALKARVASEMPGRVRRYSATWDAAHGRVTGLEAWGQQVLEDLWTVLDADTVVADGGATATWQDEERAGIEAFVEQRGRLVLGRDALLDTLQAKALSPVGEGVPWGSVVVAEPGTGKSAVFAALHVRLAARPEVLVLAQVAGISARAGSVDALLRRFCQELAAAGGRADPCTDAMGFEELQKTFAEQLSRAAANRRVVVLLDALNEFEDTPVAQHLTWLPERWPRNARLVATTLPGVQAEALGKRAGVERVDLGPLGAADARAIVEAVCARYRKTLPGAALDALLGRTTADGALSCGRPLWLHLAVEDLLLLDEDDFARTTAYSGTPEQQLIALLVDTARSMPAEIKGLYGALLDHAEAVHGAAWTRAFAELLATSRHGLRETDLRMLMPALSGEAWDPLRFANLRRGFRAHVVLRGSPERWDFFHGQMREAIASRGLADPAHRKRAHAAIAAHLAGLDPADPVRCTERMVHLIGADDVEGAARAYAASEGAELAGASVALAQAAGLAELHGKEGVEWVCGLVGVDLGTSGLSHVLERFNGPLHIEAGRVCETAVRRRLLGSVIEGWRSLQETDPANTKPELELEISFDWMGMLEGPANPSEARRWFELAHQSIRRRAQRGAVSAADLRALCGSFVKRGQFEAPVDPAQARDWLEQGVGLAEQLVQLEPKSVLFLCDLSGALLALGSLEARYDTPKARRLFGQALEIRHRIKLGGPDEIRGEQDDPDGLRALMLTCNEIGQVTDDENEARQWFERSLEIAEGLLRSDPDNPERLRDISVALNRVADLGAATEPAKQRICIEQGLEIARRLLLVEPENRMYLRDMEVWLNRLGGVHAGADPTMARDLIEQSIEIARGLVSLEPDNRKYLHDLSAGYYALGGVDIRVNPARARLCWDRGVEAARRLVQMEPTDRVYTRLLADLLGQAGWLHAETDPGVARPCLVECLGLRQELVRLDPRCAGDLLNLSVSLLSQLGRLDAPWDVDKAREWLERSIEVTLRLVQLDPDNTDHLSKLSACYSRLGALDAAIGPGRRRELFEKSVRTCSRIVDLEPSSQRAREDLAREEGNLRILLLRQAAGLPDSSGARATPAPAPAALPTFTPTAHPGADPERAYQLNVAHIEAMRAWNALPWYKRLITPKPERPTGI